MSDREALLEAAFAAPADDAPRLVYADWLDEHGEPAQAAFIRAQVELARTDPDDPAHARLDEQLDGLWDRFFVELGPTVTADVLMLKAVFHRGLPAVPIHVSVLKFRDRSPHWWPRLPIRAVIVDLATLSIAEFVRIPYLSRLRELVLTGEDPHGMVIPRLVKCHLLSDLRVLDLSQFDLGVEAAEALAGAELFRGLSELRLPYTLRPNRGLGRLLRQQYGDACRF